ncbi:MAG: FAD binding domain-containing protein [Aigarchaeota archaeon]|nr:FAD binding domain-containing protein [Candidatus Calditenuis fumarioli]
MQHLADVEVYSVRTLREALELLSSVKGLRVIAGGTDLIVQLKTGVVPKTNLLDVSRVDELRYVRFEDGILRIGALTTFMEIYRSELVRRHAPLLAEAAFTVGSFQIMNKGTIGGNIVNASPAADSLPPLYALNAELKIVGPRGERFVRIQDFYKGYKKLDLMADELVAEVRIRPPGEGYVGHFFKHGLRRGDAIAVVNGAVLLRLSPEGIVRDARVALGAVAPTVVRSPSSERVLVGSRLSPEVMWRAAEAVVNDISPIDDVRGSAAYRRELSVNYVFMTLYRIARETGVVA